MKEERTRRKSFVLYTDVLELVKKSLTLRQKGELLDIITSYQSGEDIEPEDLIVYSQFEFIKLHLDRDAEKYSRTLKGNPENASKGGKAKAENRRKKDERNARDRAKRKALREAKESKLIDEVKEELKTPQTSPERFLEWYNTTYSEIKGRDIKYVLLTPEDEANLKTLKSQYKQTDFNQALKAMSKNEWITEKGLDTPSHFLKPEQFQKYASTDLNKVMSRDDKLLAHVKKNLNPNKPNINDTNRNNNFNR